MKKIFLLGTFILSCYFLQAQRKNENPPVSAPIARDTFPVPPANKNLLFYIQRNSNINTVVYELNPAANGKPNEKLPVHIFWIRYAQDKQHEELSYIQRTFGYGLNVKPLKDDVYELTFVSYKKMKIYLQYSEADKQYITWTGIINPKKIRITRFFLKISGGTFWVPKVDYIEIKGTDMTTGKPVVDRFVP